MENFNSSWMKVINSNFMVRTFSEKLSTQKYQNWIKWFGKNIYWAFEHLNSCALRDHNSIQAYMKYDHCCRLVHLEGKIWCYDTPEIQHEHFEWLFNTLLYKLNFNLEYIRKYLVIFYDIFVGFSMVQVEESKRNFARSL